jgi:restriction system protein
VDGYQFEQLVGTLLRNMGFIVEHTPLSGDGGIDIIATTNKPIYKGTYLIQCKYWSSPIGEPAIRDLYGVVISRNANKGIVITNSTFSERAMEFASDKNIELIDGSALNNLFSIYHKKIEMQASSSPKFIDYKDFEKDKYNYLIKRIEKEKTNQSAYESLLNFYIEQLNSLNYDTLKAGLLDEIITFINEYINRLIIADRMSRQCGVLSHYLRTSEPVSARGRAIVIQMQNN